MGKPGLTPRVQAVELMQAQAVNGYATQARAANGSPAGAWEQDKDRENHDMKTYTAIVEQCPKTGFYVGSIPGFPGAHSQGETPDELRQNLEEVVAMLLEDGEPEMESEFIGVQEVAVA